MRTLFVLALCLTVSPLLADEMAMQEKEAGMKKAPPTPTEMAAKRLEHMDKALALKPDQKSKIGRILESAAAEMQELHKKLQKLERETNERIRALLEDEQKDKFDMMRARRKMLGHGQGPGKMHGKPGKQMRPHDKGAMGPGGMDHPKGEHPKHQPTAEEDEEKPEE